MPNKPPRSSAEMTADHFALSPKQKIVLDVLQDFPDGARASDIAELLGVHINTVRGHLDELVESRAVETITAAASGRGRPSLLFRSRVPNSDDLNAQHVALIEELTHNMSYEDGLELGRSWAKRLGLAGSTDEDNLIALLHRLGFTPQRRGETIHLNSCPFVHDGHMPGIAICAIHEGFIRTSLRMADESIDVTPLGGDGYCTLRVIQD
ncbi:transcriptional regulator [Corynebacterium glucuronolyticum]|uniref:Transcriptional regulator n=1 Tax=Corynebacterium glucuronolyticum TaxID=39791 RepID=A0A7T4EGP9_9CORY|nr:hypothetical protein [Corynebacterium glucuronolyticum]QQB47051.1 transcriptional regulator [Corynebacterium glucuronolyticum]WKD64646.1 hypothetical protein CGLUCO_12155 [Corynebacterium glucuronolyticum DSM 44120]SMB86727.1 Predicted transcriptional regulator, ArsR family [Corynebacterium glucuronolyticum]